MKKICFVGLGKMGSALLKGIISSGIYPPEDIIGADIAVDNLEKNSSFYGIETSKDNYYAASRAEIVLLAVKPQVMDEVLEEIKGKIKNKLIISIAAGINIKYLKKSLSECKIIRVMPNTPSLVKAGISAISAGTDAVQRDIEMVKRLFTAVGEVIEVKENLLDAVTGLSGSGPAYIYMAIEALSDGGVLMGLPRKVADKLAAQMVFGAAKMALETGKHTGELKNMVTSPGGTTIRAVEELEKNGLRSSLITAVRAAAERSEELKGK